MTEFPVLSDSPDVEAWEEQKAFDPTIRARSEGGYTKTRPRTTRVPMQWKLQYSFLSPADKSLLQAFENGVRVGSDAFNWRHPAGGTVHAVRFSEPVRYSPVNSNRIWKAVMILEEV